MTDRPQLDLVVRLGHELGRLGLQSHLEHLRDYYRARMRRVKRPPLWDDEMVLGWLRILRIPPHDTFYRVQKRNAGCASCAAKGNPGSPFTKTVFPGGHLSGCAICRAEWLELDG